MKNKAIQVSIVSLVINVILSILKLIAGLFGKSSAMISDAVHSASDVITTIIVIVGIKLSSKKEDEEHPYGHERMESIASIVLAISLFMVGLGIGFSAVQNIYTKEYVVPETIAIVAAILSILIKEWMYHFTIRTAKELNCDSLRADAWHHRSDALSSVGALVGIFLSQLGYPIMDSIASIIICFFIMKVAIDIFKDGCSKLVDTRCNRDVEKEIYNTILSVEKVEQIDDLKTRAFGNMIYVDVEVSIDENVSFKEAHTIAENVHDLVEKVFPNCKHCMVHANPIIIDK